MNETVALLVPLAVAIVAPIGAYLLAARRMSGKIATSDAQDLWREASEIRRDCRQQLEVAERRIEKLGLRIGEQDEVIGELRATIRRLELAGR